MFFFLVFSYPLLSSPLLLFSSPFFFSPAWNHYNEGLSIWDAVRLGDVPRVKELLESSKKYRDKVHRYKCKGWTPLPQLERDHLNARGVDGQTPLHLIVMMRDNELHENIFNLLMEHNADVSAQTIEGYTPLHYCMASKLENTDMLVRMLDKADTQKNARDRLNGKNGEVTMDEKYSELSLQQLSRMSEELAFKKRKEEAQREEAQGEEETPPPPPPSAEKWVCQRCNHPNPGGAHGVKACGACCKVPSKWFLELERERRPIDMTTVYGATVASIAIKTGREDRLALVLRYSPDLNRPDEEGDTMLMSAVKNNRLDLIKLLLEHGADGSTANYFSETALTYAQDLCLENDDDILMMLTDANGDLPWMRLRMRWMRPEVEWNISNMVLHQQRLLHRKETGKGSLVKWSDHAKSKRRRGLEHEIPTKFNLDYGEWFGRTKTKIR